MVIADNLDKEIARLWELLETKIMKREFFYRRLIDYLTSEGYLNKDSRILCAATGHGTFYSILLKEGYDVYGNDGSFEMLERLNRNVEKHKHKPTNFQWKDLSKHYNKSFFDFIFSEGNSLIYAGSWAKARPDLKKSEAEIEKAIFNKAILLKNKGNWYVELPKENEQEAMSSNVTVTFEGKTINFSYSFFNDWKKKVRVFTMKENNDGKEVIQKAPLITCEELKNMASKYFRSMKKINLNDPHYQGYILIK